MTFKLLAVGKTSLSSLEKLIEDYKKRINFYTKFDIEIIENIKNTKNISEEEQKNKEGSIILQKISPNDILILRDDRGKE